MKILITSDSHGMVEELNVLKKLHKDADYFIHCGDSELSKSDKAVENFHIVKGNCDYGNDFPEELIVQAGEERIYVTHGHLFNVKSTLMNLHYRAKEKKASIVCFGHSHILGYEQIDGCLFINPGSLLLPRMRQERTYIILELLKDKRIISVYEYENRLLFKEEI